MKNLMIGLLVMGTFSAKANSCLEVYEKAANVKTKNKAEYAEWSKNRANKVAPFLTGSVIATAINPTALPVAVTLATYQATMYSISLAYAVSNAVGSPEERALSYAKKAENVTGFMKQTLKKAQKKSPNATMDDVVNLVNQGFESEDFCSGKNLFGPQKIKKYVLERI